MADLEPAQHDTPDGPEKGWKADMFGPDDYVDPDEVERLTEPVHDGAQTDGHV